MIPGSSGRSRARVQAGQPNWLKYYVRYATGAQHPVFGMPDRAAATSYDYKRIRLHAKGAGIRVGARPDRTPLRNGSLEVLLRPRRAGTMRIWATVDGVRTNTMKVRVIGGC